MDSVEQKKNIFHHEIFMLYMDSVEQKKKIFIIKSLY